MVLGLDVVLTQEVGDQREGKSVKEDALPLPDNPSGSVNEGRLTQTLEAKDLESPMSGRIVSNRKNGGAREDQIVSGRVWTRGDEPKRGKLVLWLSHPPSSFSAPVMVTSSLQVPTTRERVTLALRDIQREKHGSTMKDKTASEERTLRPTENSKTSNDCVAQGTRRTVGQSFTDGQESQTTEEIIPLTTRMDMECQTLLPSEGDFLIAGATPDKNDDGTRTAAASTASTVDTGNGTEGTRRIAVNRRFQPILLCGGSVDLRGSLRGFGDCRIVSRSSLGRRVIGRIYCTNWGDIVLDSERSASSALCISSGESHSSENLGQRDLGRKDCGTTRNCNGVCRTDFGERGELVVCEELARFLQGTYYRRLTAYGIWKNGIASRLSKSATGKKSKAGRYGRKGRSTARSGSPAGQ